MRVKSTPSWEIFVQHQVVWDRSIPDLLVLLVCFILATPLEASGYSAYLLLIRSILAPVGEPVNIWALYSNQQPVRLVGGRLRVPPELGLDSAVQMWDQMVWHLWVAENTESNRLSHWGLHCFSSLLIYCKMLHLDVLYISWTFLLEIISVLQMVPKRACCFANGIR